MNAAEKNRFVICAGSINMGLKKTYMDTEQLRHINITQFRELTRLSMNCVWLRYSFLKYIYIYIYPFKL